MKKWQWISAILAVASILVIALYPDVVSDLNGVLFAVDGDGLKNYFNFLYHIRHDADYMEFTGMNYPYGETMLMVDGHPLWSNILKWVSSNIVDISPYSVGILNFGMLASLPVCAVFMYLVLTEYKLPPPSAAMAAIGITFLSSNVLLWQYGHYALSYTCFFPVSWYLLIRYESTGKHRLYSVLIFLNTLFWIYTHNYLGLIVLGFTAAYHVFQALQARSARNLKRLVDFVIQVVVPAGFVLLLLGWLDTHEGRIDMTYHTEHRASFYSVFMPNHSWLRPLYDVFFNLEPQSWQSWCKVGAYVGLTTNLVMIAATGVLIARLVKTRKWIFKSWFNKSEVSVMLAGVALLLFSMAIPFRYGLDFLLPEALKQFLGLGRFAWAFYFISAAMSIVLLSRWLDKKPANIVIGIAALLLFSEGLSYHRALKAKIPTQGNVFSDDSLNELLAELSDVIEVDDYQAILPLPFYHKYISLHRYGGSSTSEQISMTCSYATGLPLMSAILSRPSVLESRNIVQVLSPLFVERPVLSEVSDKAILVIHTGEWISEHEKELLDLSRPLHQSETIEFRHLSIDAIARSPRDEMSRYAQIADSLHSTGTPDCLGSSEGYFYRNSFDGMPGFVQYRGGGAQQLVKTDSNVLFQSDPGEIPAGRSYVFSFWYFNHLYDQTFNSVWLEVRKSDGRVVRKVGIDPARSNDYEGNWAYNELAFDVKDQDEYVVVISKGQPVYSNIVYFDELMIRPEGVDIYCISGDTPGSVNSIMLNNIDLK